MQPIPSVEELNTFFNSIGANVGASKAQEALTTFDRINPDTAALSSTIEEQLGVGSLRDNVSGLRKSILDTENAIDGVEDSVLGRTSNNLVSQAQVDALTRKEQEPLFDLLATRGRALESGTIDLNDAQTRADRLLGFTRDDIGSKRQSIVDRLNLALNREAEAKAAAQRQSALGDILNRFNSISESLAGLGSQITASRDRISAANASTGQFLQNARSARLIQPTASSRVLQNPSNPQRVGSGSRVQNAGFGSLLQGRNSITSSNPLTVRNSGGGRVTGVTRANPGRITSTGYAQPKSRIVGVTNQPYSRIIGVR